eukprot:TRINITY_DN642_c0_g2_i1.p1 TRINITY_DN642_c0_g2~~TRINITY_DN642_c0_g2_i1.p1  ORF type:complete len:122 (+),score=5.48 TRINITY_DN642_c0_g2_i1:62-427(+)
MSVSLCVPYLSCVIQWDTGLDLTLNQSKKGRKEEVLLLWYHLRSLLCANSELDSLPARDARRMGHLCRGRPLGRAGIPRWEKEIRAIPLGQGPKGDTLTCNRNNTHKRAAVDKSTFSLQFA